MIKPKKLISGDLIAFISPSSSLSAFFPQRIARAEKFFINAGYKIKIGSTVNLNFNGKAGNIKQRVQDIHDQFSDGEVKAIIATAGGLSSNELLRELDYELIKENPKIFCGYSDITLLSAAFLNKSNLTSFYGPCVVTEFGEYRGPLDFTIDSFFKAVTGRIGIIKPSKFGTDKFVDWLKYDKIERELEPNPDYEWLIEGQAEGKLIGGCMPSLKQLSGTGFDYNYDGSILFLDIPEGEVLGKGMPPSRIESLLGDIALSGKLNKIRGLLIGRLFRQPRESEVEIKKIFYDRMRSYGIPVLYGIDIGHRDPKITVPLGANSYMDSRKNLVEILEQGVMG